MATTTRKAVDVDLSTDSELPPLPKVRGVTIKHIAGWPGHAVGDNGTVWSCIPLGRHVYRMAFARWRKLRCFKANGYKRVRLGGRKNRRDFYVHRLVLTTFIGPRADATETRHLDGNRTNNRLSNLAWGTASDNAVDRLRHGKAKNLRLSVKAVLDIRAVAPYQSRKQIARRYRVACNTINDVVARRTWTLV